MGTEKYNPCIKYIIAQRILGRIFSCAVQILRGIEMGTGKNVSWIKSDSKATKFSPKSFSSLATNANNLIWTHADIFQRHDADNSLKSFQFQHLKGLGVSPISQYIQLGIANSLH